MTRARIAVGGVTATLSIAALTWKRVLRGRSIWVTAVLALLPLLVAVTVVSRNSRHDIAALLEISVWLLAVLVPLHVASSLSEELEDRTAAYLWSRPIPRWTILSGKLLALIPIAAAANILGTLAAAQRIGALGTTLDVGTTVLALGLGSFAAACCSAGISTLYPKHGMAISIIYLLFVDLPVGAIPAALQNVSITFHVRTLVRNPPSSDPIIALAVLSAIWLLVALFRIRRLE